MLRALKNGSYQFELTISQKNLPKILFLLQGFKINFHFAPNDFFKNEILSKEFVLEYSPKSDEPFQPGKEKIAFTCGTVIIWKSGKDLTKRTIKEKVPKTKRSKAKGKTRNVKKVVNREKSFFYFFDDDYSNVEAAGAGPSAEFLEFAFNEAGLHLRYINTQKVIKLNFSNRSFIILGTNWFLELCFIMLIKLRCKILNLKMSLMMKKVTVTLKTVNFDHRFQVCSYD